MAFSTYWNEIVSEYNDNLSCKEEIVQKTWEVLFRFCFGYSKTEIDSQRSVKMGVMNKRADIVITNGEDDLFVVELKRHTLHEGQEQLFSYLNQLKIDVGILVCDNLYIYDYDYTAKENAFSVLEIPFVQDNPNGSYFVELFSKENFNKQKIKDFIKECNGKKESESEIKKELSANLISDLLKKYFSEKYHDVEIEKILEEYTISICPKSAIRTAEPMPTFALYAQNLQNFSPAYSSTKDNTQYMVNGTPTGGKGRTVYATVELYVKSHIEISFTELQNAFPDSMAKPGFGKMVRRLEEVSQKEWSGSRFNRHPIALGDGTQVVVSTQWKPDNMQSFIAGAKRLGIEITPLL